MSRIFRQYWSRNLYYFGDRYYDPDVAVWTSPDAMRQFYNPYSYAGNWYNPVDSIDPDGNNQYALIEKQHFKPAKGSDYIVSPVVKLKLGLNIGGTVLKSGIIGGYINEVNLIDQTVTNAVGSKLQLTFPFTNIGIEGKAMTSSTDQLVASDKAPKIGVLLSKMAEDKDVFEAKGQVSPVDGAEYTIGLSVGIGIKIGAKVEKKK